MRFAHFNFNVLNLDTSLAFYEKALGLTVARRVERDDFVLCYLTDGATDFQLELTWLRHRTEKYDLGECEFHLAFVTPDYENVRKKHEEMGCICFDNPQMGIYFIEDPDGYWLEIVPERR